jgi:MFS family permease
MPSVRNPPAQHRHQNSQIITKENSSEESQDFLEELPTPELLPPTYTGLLPWLQVLGGFFLMFNSWGIAVSYGTFQSYYTTGGITDEDSPSKIAWIGSIQVFLLLVGGALGGKYFDAGYFRPMVACGTFLVVFGLIMTSISHKYYEFMLAQGVCLGIGTGCFLIPSVGLPGTWFNKRRGLAVGCVTMGSSTAGIVYPVLLHKLIVEVGFPWAVRTLGLVALVTLIVPNVVLRQRLPPRQRGSFVEYQALREPVFALYAVGIFLTFLGFFGFYTFVGAWAASVHLNTKGLPVFYILPIVNAASLFGRIFPNYLSDFVGRLNVQTPSIAIAGLLVLTWLSVHSIGGLLAVAVLYGFFSGALVGLPPATVASLTPDMTTFGGRLGVVFMVMGFASLIGSPVMGAIVQAQNGSYDGARVWAGVAMVVGSFCLFMARMIKANWVFWTVA